MTKQKPPILPSSNTDPTGTNSLERAAIREFKKKIKSVVKIYTEALESIQSSPVVNKRYVFQLDEGLLSGLLRRAETLVNATLLQGGDLNLWFYYQYVKVAYQRGTAKEFANLSQQSDIYLAGQQSLENIILSQPYQLRLALVRARVFEEMNGLTASIKADMARILTDGIARGLNPREIAKNLNKQAGICLKRANRIARTEINTALRRARWEEADEAFNRLGIRTKQLHLSAFSPTTRRTHALRHGNLYTTDELRDWYSKDGNAINCKCTQVAVVVNEKGEPLYPNVVNLAKKRLEKAKKNGLLAGNCECGHIHKAA